MATRNPVARVLASGVLEALVSGDARLHARACRASRCIAAAGGWPRSTTVFVPSTSPPRGATSRSSSACRRIRPKCVASPSRWSSRTFTAWVDFLHFATRPPEEAARLVEGVIGYSRIVEGRLSGKGVLLLTAHLGNWEVGGLMLAQVNQPIHVVLVPGHLPGSRARAAPAARALRASRRSAWTAVSCRRSRVLRALGENAIVAMQGDRDFDNTGVAIPFFGREAFFPRGPLRVAMASGATVLPAFIVRAAGRPLSGDHRGAARRSTSDGDRDAALARKPPAVRGDPRALRARLPGPVVLLLSVLGRPVAQARGREPGREAGGVTAGGGR